MKLVSSHSRTKIRKNQFFICFQSSRPSARPTRCPSYMMSKNCVSHFSINMYLLEWTLASRGMVSSQGHAPQPEKSMVQVILETKRYRSTYLMDNKLEARMYQAYQPVWIKNKIMFRYFSVTNQSMHTPYLQERTKH